MVRSGGVLGGHRRGGWTLLFLHSHSGSVAACMPLSPVPCGFVDLHLISRWLIPLWCVCARSRVCALTPPAPSALLDSPVCPCLYRTDAETVYSLLLLGPLLGLKKQIFQRRLVLVSQSTPGKQQAVRGGLLAWRRAMLSSARGERGCRVRDELEGSGQEEAEAAVSCFLH